MSKRLNRRKMLKVLGTAPLAGSFSWSEQEVRQAIEHVHASQSVAAGEPYTPQFFTPHEYEMVRILVDLILPRDERSGSATEAGVPEFMDFMMIDQPERQVAMRGGLAWLERECQKRFDRGLLQCDETQRTQLVEDIAWPERARPEYSQGAAFFTRFRDLTATGFWSSRMGVEDLQYLGNVFVAEWTGCPPEALEKLDVSYD